MKLAFRLTTANQARQHFVTLWQQATQSFAAGQRLIIELRTETRSTRQNKLLHALLNDVAAQKEFAGKRRTMEQWKQIFVSGHAIATKEDADIVPGIEGEFLNLRESTAKMSVQRMTSLIEYVMAWCAGNGVELKEAREWES